VWPETGTDAKQHMHPVLSIQQQWMHVETSTQPHSSWAVEQGWQAKVVQ
jgi:hypothetical protein